MAVKLTPYEQEMLDGKYGRFKQVALENVLKYAQVVGAEELVEITKSTLYFGAHSYLETCDSDDYDKIFSKMYLCTDERVELGEFEKTCYCQTCVAPCDEYDYEFNRLPKELFDRNKQYLSRTLKAGCCIAGSCTPYLNGWVPLMGEYVVTSESSNITMSNSVFGARCNADGEEAITWISICGRAPKWGFYLPENRYADTVFHIECESKTRFDWDLIGYTVGRMLPPAGVPVLTGGFDRPTLTMLKQCFTAMATTSACEMCHIVGVTPEARSLEDARGNKELRGEFTITQADIEESRRELCSLESGPVDYVILGCPHYSLEDIQQVARYLEGKKIADGVEFSVWTDMSTREMAKQSGFMKIIEDAGGRLMSSSCPLVMDPVAFAHVNGLATDSGKQGHYIRSGFPKDKHVPVWYGDIYQIIDAAVEGYWKGEKVMENTVIKGRGAYNGVMEGEALVLPDSVQGWAGLDEKTGIIIEKANSKVGEYIGGKILVLPCAKGSNGWASHFYSAKVAGHCPTAWVIQKLDSRCAACIVELAIPAVVETECDPCQAIHDGDIIRVDGTNGIVEILKRAEK